MRVFVGDFGCKTETENLGTIAESQNDTETQAIDTFAGIGPSANLEPAQILLQLTVAPNRIAFLFGASTGPIAKW